MLHYRVAERYKVANLYATLSQRYIMRTEFYNINATYLGKLMIT